MKKFFHHPLTQKTRTIVRRTIAVASVILAVVVVTTLSMDLGPRLRELAERQGTNYLKRSMHIGRLKVYLWDGHFEVEDLIIDGLTPQSRPWLVAKTIKIYMPWSTLFTRRIVFSSIDMTDWKMYVEYLPDGRTSFPKFPQRAGGPSKWTTTLQYVRASRGEFKYDDKGTPWSVITRNLDVTVSKPSNEYRGKAKFFDGLVSIQNYVPFRADMDTAFKIVGGRVVFDAINLTTDGTKSVLKGDVDLSHWPEQMYSVKSKIDLPRMRQIFFANDKFELAGSMDFDGVFHLFKGEPRPDGKFASGRELKGNFSTNTAYVNVDARDYRLDDLKGYVRWIPDALEVHDATANVFGGNAQFEYAMAPLGQRGVKPTNSFDAVLQNVDVTTLSDFFELRGIRFAGTLSGHNLLQWPSGEWSQHRGHGDISVTPPDGVALMTRQLPIDVLQARAPRGQARGVFSPHLPKGPVPIGGTLTYAFGPEWIDLGPTQIATPTTYVEIQGRTAYGERSRMPFHVSSSDWQDSDRLFSGVLTAFGSNTKVIPVDGYGTFDGVMLNAFRRPRIEGTFAGEQMRAFDVTWGTVKGDAVIENSYADVKNVVVSSGMSTITADGRFSLGYPRKDLGEEIDARVRIIRRPIGDLKHAFGIDDYDLDGNFSGDFHVTGKYEQPLGYGTMGITEGVAYGESFETANASVTLEGTGVRLNDLQISKGSGRGTGSAFVTWNGTYSFNFNASNIAVETLNLTSGTSVPLSGLIDFTAVGNGSFDRPEYSVRGRIQDFFVADEGIGIVVGDLTIKGDLLTIDLNAGSSRLGVTGGGTLALTPSRDVEMTFRVTDTSLDPYIRAFQPRLSPYTTAIASGTLHIYGEAANIDNIAVDVNVERFDARFFDYGIRNPDDPKIPGQRLPLKLAFDRHDVRVVDMRLVGDRTELTIGGDVDLHNEQINMQFTGDANLAILEGFTRNVRSTGVARLRDARLVGPMRDPTVSGRIQVDNGRIRHFSLPHSLDAINGVITFDSGGIHLDELSARMGAGRGGAVTFGGSIGIEGYRPGRIDVTMHGDTVPLRFAEQGLRATVNADLQLQGTVEAMTLRGDVEVLDAVYSRNFDAGGSLFDFGGGQPSGPVSSFTNTTIPLSYDVDISAPSSILVRNNLMNRVQASANLRLVGTFERPGVLGEINVDRGELLVEGKRYEIRRGRIQFNNPTKIEPFFDVETETRIRVPGETYRITVATQGLDPTAGLRFSSDPELPQYELFALLFSDIPPGRDIELRQYTGITPQEQLFRERVTRALTGAVSSEITRAVQDAFAVDTFQCTTSLFDPNQQSARLDPGAHCTVGKRLGERVFLTYSRSLASTTRDQVIVLEIDQTDRLSWILSRNEDGTYAVDFRVRRTF